MFSRFSNRPGLVRAWVSLAAVSAVLGIAYVLGEEQLFAPGGWFALDGRRLFEASSAWLAGREPYAVRGFVYSPVALFLAAPWTLLPQALAVLAWIATSAALAAIATARTLQARPRPMVLIGMVGVIGFLPTLADLVLANVTIVLVVAILPILRANQIWAGIAFGVLAAAFPKPFVIPILLWVLVWRPQGAIGAVLGGLVATAIAALMVGPAAFGAYLSTLMSGGGIPLRFLGNYGISLISPPVALVVGLLSAAAFVIVLFRRGPVVGLAWAGSVGVLIAPYAGIYASLPMLVALPGLAAIAPGRAWLAGLAIVLVAPWSPISAVVVMALTLTIPLADDRSQPTWVRRNPG